MRGAWLLLFVSFGLFGETRTISLDPAAMKALNVKVENVKDYKGRPAVRVTDVAPPDANDGMRFVLLPGTEFADGTLEVDVTGALVPNAMEGARGFVGLAFRVAPDGSRFECFYLRPTNGRAEDQVQRNHSTQYIAFPDFPWQKARSEFPSKYESYTDLVPGEWTHVKIAVKGDGARLYVNEATQPTLIVNDLKHGNSQGGIALWVGPGTLAHFANLKVSR